jgi:hypothetical protein
VFGALKVAMKAVAGLVGKVLASPYTALGIAVGLLGLPFGAKIQFGNNAIQFTNFPLGEKGTGLTLGNAQIYPVGSDPKTFSDYFYNSPIPLNLGLHEQGHTIQYQVLGPLFLPVWLLTGGLGGGLELGANNYANGGSAFRW